MRRRGRVRRVRKWVGTVLSLSMIVLAAASFQWMIDWDDGSMENRVAITRGVLLARDAGALVYEQRRLLERRCTFGEDAIERALARDGQPQRIERELSGDRQRRITAVISRGLRAQDRPLVAASRGWFLWHNTKGVRAVGVPLWIPFLLVALPTAFLWYLDRRIPPGHCQRCGYDLTGNVSGRCSECGVEKS